MDTDEDPRGPVRVHLSYPCSSVFIRGGTQQCPPASTRKNASMSASVPMSPSPLKSATPQPPVMFKMAASLRVEPHPLETTQSIVALLPAGDTLLNVRDAEVAPETSGPSDN